MKERRGSVGTDREHRFQAVRKTCEAAGHNLVVWSKVNIRLIAVHQFLPVKDSNRERRNVQPGRVAVACHIHHGGVPPPRRLRSEYHVEVVAEDFRIAVVPEIDLDLVVGTDLDIRQVE